jgi:hypothetical protein
VKVLWDSKGGVHLVDLPFGRVIRIGLVRRGLSYRTGGTGREGKAVENKGVFQLGVTA